MYTVLNDGGLWVVSHEGREVQLGVFYVETDAWAVVAEIVAVEIFRMRYAARVDPDEAHNVSTPRIRFPGGVL